VLPSAQFRARPSVRRGDDTTNHRIGDRARADGVKSLDEDNWAPVEDHVAFGAEVTFGKENWPIWIALDYLESAKEEKDVPIEPAAASSGAWDRGSTSVPRRAGPKPRRRSSEWTEKPAV